MLQNIKRESPPCGKPDKPGHSEKKQNIRKDQSGLMIRTLELNLYSSIRSGILRIRNKNINRYTL